jgi:hypothetical protein
MSMINEDYGRERPGTAEDVRALKASQQFRRAAAPLLRALAEADLPVNTPRDLLRLDMSEYRRSVPTLLFWLPRTDDQRVKESIVRTLTMKAARPLAAPVLVQEFQGIREDNGLKWAIGNALSVVADDSVFEDIVRLVQDRRHGRAREMLAYALGNMKDPRAVDVLVKLLDDDEVAGHALRPLGKLRAHGARRDIERFLNHPKAWVRKEAKRALLKIDKAAP